MERNVIAATAAATDSIADLIGNTPLVRLRRFEREVPAGVELYAKAEWKNPGGSVKDRAALRMIQEGERTGKLQEGGLILDATSGNTGIAYAMIGAARGYTVRLCIPENVTPERKRILRAYGADIIFTDPLEGSDGAIREVRRIYEADPDRYFYPDQYNNPANCEAHYDTTGPEILAQTAGRVTHFVAGLGTSGTFMGAGRFFRDRSPSVQLVSVQPDTPLHGLEGLKHMRVATEDAYEATRRLAVEEGLLVGISSGAALDAGLRVGRMAERAVIVMIFSDGGEKYLSERFWEEPAEGYLVGGVN